MVNGYARSGSESLEGEGGTGAMVPSPLGSRNVAKPDKRENVSDVTGKGCRFKILGLHSADGAVPKVIYPAPIWKVLLPANGCHCQLPLNS